VGYIGYKEKEGWKELLSTQFPLAITYFFSRCGGTRVEYFVENSEQLDSVISKWRRHSSDLITFTTEIPLYSKYNDDVYQLQCDMLKNRIPQYGYLLAEWDNYNNYYCIRNFEYVEEAAEIEFPVLLFKEEIKYDDYKLFYIGDIKGAY